MTRGLALVPIDRDGVARGDVGAASGPLVDALQATVELYERSGFEEPWVSYVALVGQAAVGICGFTAPPRDGRVEIAYYTFPGGEGRGYATAMAAELLAIAHRRRPDVTVTAQTVPARNASHRVLEKLGFAHVAMAEDAEAGTVWEWSAAAGDGGRGD